MDQDQNEMESRLDDVLSRIAKEAQEIKELEQQLTDGQILANEALKRDLEGVICGLQQYLKSLSAQGKSDDDEMWSELTEVRPDMDQARTRIRSYPRTGRRLRGKACRDEGTAVRLTSVGSGVTLDSGLDLHLLSSPERLPPTAAMRCLYGPTMREHHHHHHHHHNTDTDEDSPTPRHRCSTEAHPPGGAHKQDKKKRLRSETEKLQHTLRRHRRVLGVCTEVWCVEQTLMKRRAELREAQRLLQQAHGSVTQARREAAEWESKAKDSATCLQKTQQQLRVLQDEVEALKKFRSDHRDLNMNPDINLKSQTQMDSLRNQEEQLQQIIQDLRDQETRAKTSLQTVVQQQEALLSQRRCLVSAAAEEKQSLDLARSELKQILEELLSEQQQLVCLKKLRSKDFSKLQDMQDELEQTQTDLDRTRTELIRTRTELDQTRIQADRVQSELNQAEDQLDRTSSELVLKLHEVRKKQEELIEKQEELDQSQAATDRKKVEHSELVQEVEVQRKEAESCLIEIEQQRKELQEVKDEVQRAREQSSSLQKQCRHLEDRRRHAQRCLSAAETELSKLKQEQSQSQLTQQEVMKETAANQEKLNESSELLCFLGEKLEEKKIHLQTVQQELSALTEEHRLKQRELQELEKNKHNSEAAAAVAEDQHRGRCVTHEQLHTLGEELCEREKQLSRIKAELRLKEEGLNQKEEELRQSRTECKGKEEKLLQEEELNSDLEDSDGASSEEFYLSTSALRSASSPEDERWRRETNRLKLQEDALKVRLRNSLQTQSRSSKAREQSVRSLRDRVEQLNGLLNATKTPQEQGLNQD